MARKTASVVIQDDGRDKGKEFLLTEMPASQAEKWAARAILALSNAGVDVPDDVSEAGMAGLASFGIGSLSRLSFAAAEPLMDEMFECIQVRPDRQHPELVRRLVEDDIEEVATRVMLRANVITLHTGFSMADAVAKYQAKVAAQNPSDTRTSPAPSAQSSRPAKRQK